MQVVGYLRVSTDRQAEEGLGLEIQEEKVRDWARSNGHKLRAIYRDEGISGSNGIDTRVGLADALAALGEGAKGLVVYRLDRLARDLVLQEQLLADVWRLGCQVFSCSPAEGAYLANDPDDPSRALIRQVLGAVSQYERSMIALRLRTGRRRKQAKGGYIGGDAPLGFKCVDGELEPVDHEIAALKRIEELHHTGASLRSIISTLESEDIRPPRSDRWHPESVRRVLARLT
jgi:DNA invertase Pin-like site-specific DNA recombinase